MKHVLGGVCIFKNKHNSEKREPKERGRQCHLLANTPKSTFVTSVDSVVVFVERKSSLLASTFSYGSVTVTRTTAALSWPSRLTGDPFTCTTWFGSCSSKLKINN